MAGTRLLLQIVTACQFVVLLSVAILLGLRNDRILDYFRRAQTIQIKALTSRSSSSSSSSSGGGFTDVPLYRDDLTLHIHTNPNWKAESQELWDHLQEISQAFGIRPPKTQLEPPLSLPVKHKNHTSVIFVSDLIESLFDLSPGLHLIPGYRDVTLWNETHEIVPHATLWSTSTDQTSSWSLDAKALAHAWLEHLLGRHIDAALKQKDLEAWWEGQFVHQVKRIQAFVDEQTQLLQNAPWNFPTQPHLQKLNALIDTVNQQLVNEDRRSVFQYLYYLQLINEIEWVRLDLSKEHYAAALAPLTFPIGVPLLLGIVREFRRYRSLTK